METLALLETSKYGKMKGVPIKINNKLNIKGRVQIIFNFSLIDFCVK